MRLPLLLALSASVFSISHANAADDPRLVCSAYYELLSVDGDQLDISAKQASKAFYALLKQAGDTPQAQEVVAQQLVTLRKEIPGQMSVESVAAFRAKHDSGCRTLLKAAWCEVYKDPGACT